MGRSKLIPIVVHLTCRNHIVTPLPWPKELGRPTVQSVSRYVVDFERSSRYGGVNYHPEDTKPMIVVSVRVHSQLTGEDLVVWLRNTHPKEDPRVIAIRADSVIGRGSCSVADECYEAIELIDELEDTSHGKRRITTPNGAVAHFRKVHKLREERAEDIRNM